MTTTIAAGHQSARLSQSARCSITELSPIVDSLPSKYIDGVVSLLWPYSSHTRRTAILLADPDFRIRKAKGQTKITFVGDCAVAVAQSHVGIGDQIKLSLEGAQWTQPDQNLSTPGKRADWDMEYSKTVYMEINKGTTPLVIQVCGTSESAPAPLHEVDINREITTRTPRPSKSQELWSSPAFVRQASRWSPPLLDVPLGSLVDDDGYIPGKGRKRAKFSRDSDSWLYVERSSESDLENLAPDDASPQEDGISTAPNGTERDASIENASKEVPDLVASALPNPHHDRAVTQDLEAEQAVSMPPPCLAEPKQHQVVGLSRSEVENEEASALPDMDMQGEAQVATPPRATTPRLLPLASPGLPLISPLVKRQGAGIGYFPPMSTDRSELDSNTEELPQAITRKDETRMAFSSSVPEVIISQFIDFQPVAVATVSNVQPQGATIDLTSPTNEAASPTVQPEPRAREYGIIAPAEPLPGPEKFELLNLIPGESGTGSHVDLMGRPVESGQIAVETPLLESISWDDFASEQLNENIVAAVSMDGAVSSSMLYESVDQVVRMSATEEPVYNKVDQSSEILEHMGSTSVVAVEHMEDERECPVELCPTESRPTWTTALEVSAREVEDHNLPISAPPFPFEQGWDERAKAERRNRQRLVAQYPDVLRRLSYDGNKDEDRASDEHKSDLLSESDSESESSSSLYEADSGWIREAVKTSLDSSSSETYESQVGTPEASSPPRTEIDAEPTGQPYETESEDHISPPAAFSDMETGLVVPSNQTKDSGAVNMPEAPGHVLSLTKAELAQRSSAVTEIEGDAQQSPEMRNLRSSSVVSHEEAHPVSTSASLEGKSPPESHTEEQQTVLVNIARAGSAALESLGSFLEPAGQLATPENTQQEVEHTENQDNLEQPRREEPRTQLPPSPQNTQDLLKSLETEDEPLIAEEGQRPAPSDSAKTPPKVHFEETEATVKISEPRTPFMSNRRRSSRLSSKMSLLGRDPSEIISPYFTPKVLSQDNKHDDVPVSPSPRSLSPEQRSHDKIVVEIPRPRKIRSALEAETVLSASPTDATDTARLPSSAKGFTTPHSYYPSLSTLPSHFDTGVDILAVAITTPPQPQRAKSGPKDYFISLKLADSTCNAGDAVSVQLFRPHKAALPTCERGHILLLRNMKVETRRTLGTRGKSEGKKEVDGMMLLSTEGSAWAVFNFRPLDAISAGDERPRSTDGSTQSPVRKPLKKIAAQVNGPPVEYGAEERAFARGLDKWWAEEGNRLFPKTTQKTRSPNQGRGKGREILADLEGAIDEKTLHEHELRDGMAYGDMISPSPLHDHRHHAGQIHNPGTGVSMHEHELRDGMAYGDTITPIPLHEHQHDHSSPIGPPHLHHPDPPARHTALESEDGGESEEEEEEEEDRKSGLHEHELRDGMAYGDTITQTPLHDHVHVYEDSDLHHRLPPRSGGSGTSPELSSPALGKGSGSRRRTRGRAAVAD